MFKSNSGRFSPSVRYVPLKLSETKMMIALAASVSIYATVQLRLALLIKDLACPMIFSSGCLARER